MLNVCGSEAGYGMGLGLLNLEEWQKSEYAAQWDSPAERRGRKTDLSTGGYLDE